MVNICTANKNKILLLHQPCTKKNAVMKIAKHFLFFLFILTAQCVIAQNPPFWDDIQAFKKQDSIQMPQQHAILFVGSSSFTKWTDVQNYFPNYPIINARI